MYTGLDGPATFTREVSDATVAAWACCVATFLRTLDLGTSFLSPFTDRPRC